MLAHFLLYIFLQLLALPTPTRSEEATTELPNRTEKKFIIKRDNYQLAQPSPTSEYHTPESARMDHPSSRESQYPDPTHEEYATDQPEYSKHRYDDCSTLNVPPISLSNVPGISE